MIVQVVYGYDKNHDDAQMSEVWDTLIQLIFPGISMPHFMFTNCRSGSLLMFTVKVKKL